MIRAPLLFAALTRSCRNLVSGSHAASASLFTKLPTFVPPHYLVKLHVCECPGGDNGKVDPAMQDFFAKLRHGALSRALDDEIRAWCFTQSLDIRHYLDAGGKL
jgi:hypothetical protein